MHLFPTVWRDAASRITMGWRGRATEREVKLHILAGTSNPSQGLAWSNAGTRGKVASFSEENYNGVGVHRRPFGTHRKLQWIGVVERL